MSRVAKCFFFILLVSVSLLSTTGCQRSSQDDHSHRHGEEHSEESERGKHGGRLLRKGSFSLELKIFETGVPPQYRIYAYDDGEPITPEDFIAEVSLERLGGRVDSFTFSPVQDFLTSEKEVEEPHSFDVNVKAKFKGEEYSWHFESYEGRTTISDKVAKLSGLQTENAGSRTIRTLSRVRGKILPSEHKIAHVIPRFSGVVREGKKHIGDKVEKGEVIAVIESNQSLQPFEVRSQISGTVINGHVIVGEFVPENQWIYIVADLSEVWADFFVPLREQLEIKQGQKLLLSSVSREKTAEGTISYVAPYADEKSQSQLVRVVIPNPNNQFLPGMFVLGDLVVSEHKVEVAVKQSAIQTFRDWQVVFAKDNDIYEIKPLELGKSDGEWIEVLKGLTAGDEYVSENAFLIKADILKSGASHDH
jgi:membrane fusion protein, heavy metal efflux system